jgi:hypothetical protein
MLTLIPTMRRCIDYAKQHEGVWFARKGDIALDARTRGYRGQELLTRRLRRNLQREPACIAATPVRC